MSDPIVEVRNLEKGFHISGTHLPVVGGVQFSQREGEFLAVLGPSGCGKSTLLRLLSGLIQPDRGEIRHQGEIVSGPPSWMSVVFQDYRRSLFPWMSVAGNVVLGAARQHGSRRLARKLRPSDPVVVDALKAVDLEAFGAYFPWQLSGGMQQRVALARAIAARPGLLLLDEPFASVDAQTRTVLQDLVLSLWRQMELSVLLVTHDIEEAIFMADRVLILSPRPTHVVSIVDIDLPRPRDQVSTKSDPRFARLRAELYGYVHSRTVSDTAD